MNTTRWLAALLLLLTASMIQARRGNESHLMLTLQSQRVQGEWEVSRHDLAAMLKHAEPMVDGPAMTTLLQHLRIGTDGTSCALEAPRHTSGQRSTGETLVMHFEATCGGSPRQLTVDLNSLFAADPKHLVLLKLQMRDLERTAALSADSARQVFTLGTLHWTERLASDMRSGAWHIWTGFDHLLFLLALLLPAVLLPSAPLHPTSSRHGTEPAARTLPSVLLEVLKVVTAFTLAHSLTLTLAGLSLVSLPPRLTESVIALSVLLAAALNLRSGDNVPRWTMAFAFGLIHGFGFASALGELDASGSTLALTLLGFNVGVEFGQLACVAVFIPLAFLLRQRSWYRSIAVRGGSVAIALLAGLWFAERAFEFSLLPGA